MANLSKLINFHTNKTAVINPIENKFPQKISYENLGHYIRKTSIILNKLNIKQQDVIALFLPNGFMFLFFLTKIF